MSGQVEPGIAGVRLVDGRLIFVAGAPRDLATGASIRLLHDGLELLGSVSIPPALLVWRDPDARCATYLGVEQASPDPPAAGNSRATQAVPTGPPGPGAHSLAAMLALARAERQRLDD